MAKRRSWMPAALFLLLLLLFFLFLQFAMEHSTPSPSNLLPSPTSDASVSDRRKRLYEKMARDLDERGAAFLNGGETSQSLSLSDLFELHDGAVVPKLKVANPPVRANVLYLEHKFATVISKAAREIFLPYFDGVVWFQNSSIYHFSMFHASHHMQPVIATEAEIEAEVSAVKRVVQAACPLKIILDRVVLTSTGVLLGLWQVESGTDPADIRARLRNALPRAPGQQLYDPVLLHTSLARILGRPKLSEEESKKPLNQIRFFHQLVAQVNQKIRGFQATVSELWYVEEFDVLALALNGRMKIRRFHLGCSGDQNNSN